MKYAKQARSPYHRYGKKPHRYSDGYHKIVSALRQHGYGSPEHLAADDAHRVTWGLNPREEEARQ